MPPPQDWLGSGEAATGVRRRAGPPSTGARVRHRWHRILGWAAAVVFIGACASEPVEEARSTSSSAPTSTTLDSEAEILAAYRGFWDAVFASLAPPDPDHPALGEFATGVQLERSRDVARADAEAGVATRPGEPPTRFNPRVQERSGQAALVADCYLDTEVRYRIDTGEVVDDRQAWVRLEARLVRVEGHWKVERTDIRELPAGETCADGES